MDSVVMIGSKIEIPEEFVSDKRKMVITMPWKKCVINGRSVTDYYRSGAKGDKPYLPEGQISFKNFGKKAKIFKVKNDG